MTLPPPPGQDAPPSPRPVTNPVAPRVASPDAATATGLPSATEQGLILGCTAALGLPMPDVDALTLSGSQGLSACFAVNELATVSTAVVGLAVADLLASAGHPRPSVSVSRERAAVWFRGSLRPQGWAIPEPWDAIAGDYPTADGWIRLHTNAPHHRAAALRVLGCPPEREAVAAAVAARPGEDLETAVVAAGGCAARLRSHEEWRTHPQGRAVSAEPLIAMAPAPAPAADLSTPMSWRPDPARPLRGLRVLDLTRVLAGPVATRLLAGLGAEVLRIDPPDWDEPALIPEVTLGKRCVRLDLRAPADRRTFETLLAGADLLVHGYRPGALAGLGYDAVRRQTLRPGLLEVSLCAWGWSGPWAGRRGFDSLVQMSTGIAEAGRRWRRAQQPVPLPVQALDHATGQLMAAAALRVLTTRLREGPVLAARLSLARTAALLVDAGPADDPPTASDALPDPIAAPGLWQPEQTDWGPARRLRAALTLGGEALRWDRGATRLGASTPGW